MVDHALRYADIVSPIRERPERDHKRVRVEKKSREKKNGEERNEV